MIQQEILVAQKILAKSSHLIALTGAGVSASCGIPMFRGKNGLWERFDSSLSHIDAFTRDPGRVWMMMRELIALVRAAEPNKAHVMLADMERHGILKGLITQNIDDLHQRAGRRYVIELHGNILRLECPGCGVGYRAEDFDYIKEEPLCRECGAVLKPGMIFFGENLPYQAMMEARLLAGTSDALLVIGTSAVVNPAAELPYIAKQNRAKIIEINLEPTGLTNAISDCFIKGKAEDIMPFLVRTSDPG